MTEIAEPGRGRGRPRGTGKPDAPALRQIAELLIISQPALKPTTAIKRVIGIDNPSAIRRLQVKWKEQGVALLEGARQRKSRAADTHRATISDPFAIALRMPVASIADLVRPNPLFEQMATVQRAMPSIADLVRPNPLFEQMAAMQRAMPSIADLVRPNPLFEQMAALRATPRLSPDFYGRRASKA